MARAHLDVDDKIQKCYDGKMDGKYGWLIISDEKILFIQEKGLLSKKYSVIHDLSREKIKEINQEGPYEIIITDLSGKTFRFQTLDLRADLILKGLASSMVPNTV